MTSPRPLLWLLTMFPVDSVVPMKIEVNRSTRAVVLSWSKQWIHQHKDPHDCCILLWNVFQQDEMQLLSVTSTISLSRERARRKTQLYKKRRPSSVRHLESEIIEEFFRLMISRICRQSEDTSDQSTFNTNCDRPSRLTNRSFHEDVVKEDPCLSCSLLEGLCVHRLDNKLSRSVI